ncbi:MAG: MFS transporter [Anaerolineae bacterium]|nr:MFS transporter [Anaerolineae bacterium]
MVTPESSLSVEVPAVARVPKWAQATAYYLAFIAIGMVTASLGPTIAGLAERTGTTLGQISILFTARALGYLVGSFSSGRLYDRLPGHPLMAGAVALMALSMALSPVIPVLWLVVIVFAITGLTEGAIDVGGNALLVWVYGARVGPYMNALHFFFGMGAFVAPVVIDQIRGRTSDLRLAYWAIAALVLPAAAWLARVPSPRAAHSTEDGAGKGGGGVLLALFVAFFFLYSGAEASFGGWVYTYGIAMGLADDAAAAYLTSAFWGALTVGRLLAIPIAARFRPRQVLLGDLVGSVLSVGAILLYPGSAVALWAGSLGLGLCMASVFPTLVSLAERRMAVTGRVAGWFLMGSSAAGMSVPWLIGQMFEPLGPRVALTTIEVVLVLAFGIWAVLSFGAHSRETA